MNTGTSRYFTANIGNYGGRIFLMLTPGTRPHCEWRDVDDKAKLFGLYKEGHLRAAQHQNERRLKTRVTDVHSHLGAWCWRASTPVNSSPCDQQASSFLQLFRTKLAEDSGRSAIFECGGSRCGTSWLWSIPVRSHPTPEAHLGAQELVPQISNRRCATASASSILTSRNRRDEAF